MGTAPKLQSRIALVTGASRGIGRAIALALAGAGADVAVNYRKEQAAAEEVSQGIRGLGRRAIPIQADVSLSADVDGLVSSVERELGPVEILVNNAGISQVKPFAELNEADWDEILRVNLKSAFLVSTHYAASKAGSIGLTHSYASLLAKEGITANAIAPALVLTDMITSNPNASTERIPVGFFGSPDEIGRVAVLLAESDFITGQTISANGGWYMT